MLSGETAIGKHPVQTVATMSAIAIRTETAWLKGELAGPVEIRTPKEIDAAVAHASHLVAKSLNARTIITYTTSGSTALRVARYRSAVPILALSSHPATRYRLALTWGVESALVENVEDMADMVKVALQQVQACHLAVPGDTVVITAGTPFGIGGRTNLLKVEQVSSNTEHEDRDND
jgi:pyruvate kinase